MGHNRKQDRLSACSRETLQPSGADDKVTPTGWVMTAVENKAERGWVAEDMWVKASETASFQTAVDSIPADSKF